MRAEPNLPLPIDLGVLRVRGADLVPFLQGQLSQDIARLAPASSLLAGYHNPQGRVIALLRLVMIAPGDVVLLLPRELAAGVAARLSKFILRSKVRLADESAQWQVTALVPDAAAPDAVPALPATEGAVARSGDSHLVCVGAQPPRFLWIAPAGAPGAHPPGCTPAEAQAWRRLDIDAGIPQVFAATSEEFVAQMLNLDVLGAIAFDKGCYTGQEVIARAHYRGRVKRRMQRFATSTAVELAPGAAGVLSDGRPFKVVQAVAAPGGRTEFLAVAPLPAADEPRHEAQVSAAPLAAQALPLPYLLPE
jgi:folate-binding protein YgfZ